MIPLSSTLSFLSFNRFPSLISIGECVPIRLFLSHLDLTPTYRSVNNVFSVKYYLNLVLVDEEDRRYFKQQEVIFWRKSPNDTSDTGVGHRGLRSAPDRLVSV